MVHELKGQSSGLEKPLQTLLEGNLEPLLGIRFLASEYATGKKHGGRIDTLGLDENDCPVILEYKRFQSENVMNQGLYYLDWLMDHQAEFKLLVLDRLGKTEAAAIDWSAPRLVCIAADFTKYDEHAVQQINRNIELIRYRMFGSDLLLFELVNAVTASTPSPAAKSTPTKAAVPLADEPAAAETPPTISVSPEEAKAEKPDWEIVWTAQWQKFPPNIREIYDTLQTFLLALGDDVQVKHLKQYVAFKRLRNFASIVPTNKEILLHLHLNPDTVAIDSKWMRDVRKIGTWGTGDLQLFLRRPEDVARAEDLLRRAYASD